MLFNISTTKRILFIFLAIVSFTSCKLKIKSPKELARLFTNNTIDISLSNFGSLPYGHTIVGKLYYNTKDKEQSFGCTTITTVLPKNPKVDESPFLMFDRGNCSFTTKVKNAEDASAHVAIIANNEDNKNISNIVMSDDGRGLVIKIPSVLIGTEDAKKLKNYISKHPDEQIVLELEFEMEKADNTVDYDLWYTPDQEEVYTLIKELYYYHQQMDKSSKLNIHFITHSDSTFKEGTQKVVKNCLSSGKYCTRARNDDAVPKDILTEMIRQKCIHNVSYSSENSNGFWEYMHTFYENCFVINNFTHKCSLTAMELAKVPEKEVMDCYTKSFTGSKKQKQFEELYENTILQNEMEERKNYYFVRLPSLYINKRLYLGEFRAETVFEGLCAGLKKKPKVCYSEGGFEKEGRNSNWGIVIIIFLVIIVNVIIFFICAKVIRQRIVDRLNQTDINKKIDTIVGSYLQMRETNSSS